MADINGISEEQLMELQRQIEALKKDLFNNVNAGGQEEPAGDRETLNGSQVRLSEDHMTAWLTLNPPADGVPYRKEELIAFLNSHGVVTGYHSSNLSAMVKKKIYCREVKAAVGMAETPGTDGYYEYRFSPERMKEPSIRADGSVDYSSMAMLQNVAKGDVVAVYRRATQGSPGYTVKGEEKKCKPSRELPPIRGRNIRKLEDGVTYISEVDGKVEVKDGRIDIQNVHEIHGDVNYITGKVEFYGDITIYGNVEAGVVIRAGRNITIKGITEGVTIYAGGDVLLEKGLVGGKKAKISAKGNVFADFVENAQIDAKGSVNANVILNSNVSANEKVVVTGKRGAIIGGYTHGLMGIEASNIGNEAEVKTVVHVGYDRKTYTKHLELYKKEQETSQLLEQTVGEMSDILKKKRRSGGRINPLEEQRLLELNRKKDECFSLLDDLKADREMVNQLMEKGKGAMVVADGPIYRGVIICADNAQLPLEHNTCYMKYSCSNGFVAGQVIII